MILRILFIMSNIGRVAERLNASVSKTDLPAMVTGVQIPPLPNAKLPLLQGSMQRSRPHLLQTKSYQLKNI